MEENNAMEQEKGFKVTDKRGVTTPDQPNPTPAEATTAPEAAAPNADGAAEFPEASMLTLILFLANSAQLGLGMMPDPDAQAPQRDLPQAQFYIDLLGMLKQKTQGNLTQEETDFLEEVLYGLRLTYVELTKLS